MLGTYMGYLRQPRAAFASSATPVCATNATVVISSEADWTSPATRNAVSGATTDCVTLSIAADFTVTGTTPFFWPVGNSDPVTVVVDGNDRTVTGDPTALNASFLGIGLKASDKLFISNLTLDGMHQSGFPGAAIDAYTYGSGQAKVYLDAVTVQNGDNDGAAYFRPQVYIRARATITDSTFLNNSNVATTRPTKHDGPGAAVMLYGPTDGSLISNSTFEGNSITAALNPSGQTGQSYGAALAILNNYSNQGNHVTIENSSFIDNAIISSDGASRGTAIGGAINSGASLTIRNSLFTGNSATGGLLASGGAIHMGQNWWINYEKPRLTVISSEFTNNTATALSGDAYGGAIGGKTMGDVLIESSTFSGNSATSTSGDAYGGGVALGAFASSTTTSIVNSTFQGNTLSSTVSEDGAAVHASGAALSVNFSTIVENTGRRGAGIFSGLGLTVTNSIVNRNTSDTAATGADAFSHSTVTSSHSLFTESSSVTGSSTTYGSDTLFSTDTQVAPLADNGGPLLPGGSRIRTMAPLFDAMALDAGSAAAGPQPAPSTDERAAGFPRVVGSAADMGAIESALPAAPAGLTATAGNGSASIAFTAGDSYGWPVTNYEFSIDGGGTWTALAPADTTSPVTIPNLTNGQTYSVQLRAVSTQGTGSASAAVIITPNAAAPPAAPIVSVMRVGSSGVRVAVERAATGSAPTSFRITAAPGAGSSCTVTSSTGGACTVTGLTPGSPYTFTAVAINAGGTSSPSAATASVRPGPQPSLDSVPLSTFVPLRGHRLRVGDEATPVTVAASANRTGLVASDSDFSMRLSGLAHDGRPAALGSDEALVLGAGRQVRASGSGFMAGTRVRLYLFPKAGTGMGEPMLVGTAPVSGSGSFAGDFAIPAGQATGTYDLQAVGITSGNAKRTLTLGVHVAGRPGRVRDLTVASTSVTGSADLTWRLPTGSRIAGVQGYLLEYRPAGAGAFVPFGVVADPFATITGLVPGCAYEFGVRAINIAGVGALATTSVVTIDGAVRKVARGEVTCRVL